MSPVLRHNLKFAPLVLFVRAPLVFLLLVLAKANPFFEAAYDFVVDNIPGYSRDWRDTPLKSAALIPVVFLFRLPLAMLFSALAAATAWAEGAYDTVSATLPAFIR